MRIYLAADHAGFALKEQLCAHLREGGYEVEDLGAHVVDESDDYPEYILPCAARVAGDTGAMGIVVGGSGHGEAMAANRVPGARAVTFYGPHAQEGYGIVRIAREHNDANILSIGARFVSFAEAREAVQIFIETPFSGDDRHVRRLGKF